MADDDVLVDLKGIEKEFTGNKALKGVSLAFRRGVSCYPSLGDVAFRASRRELERAYAEHDSTLVWLGVHPRFDVLREKFGVDQALALLSESTRRLGSVMGTRYAEFGQFLTGLIADPSAVLDSVGLR